jgi:Clp amino terminal domain, pathogenicity island component
MLSPTPRYYEVRGRAAEIARSMGAGQVAAEHFFLAMLHDGGWPVSVLTGAGIIDADQAENAVVAAMSAPGYIPSAGPSLPGGRTAGRLGDSYIGVEHAFLEIIGDRAGLPARALAGLAGLDEVEAAVLAAKNAPPRAPENAAFLPDGQDLDSDLLAALTERVPAGASFGFNSLNGRTWIHVWGDGVDGDASGAVLDAALRDRRRQPRSG